MESGIYLNGIHMGEIQNTEYISEQKEEADKLSFPPRGYSGTLSNVKTNIRMMSESTRQWCKQIKWDDKIFW